MRQEAMRVEQLFSNVRNERLFEKIVVQIHALIVEGKLMPGDRLPGERVLAETIGCSRTSLREAFRVLEAEGLIVSKSGGGRFVQNLDQNIKLEYRQNAVDMLEKSAVFYFLEAREALEPRIAQLAVERATIKQIGKIKAVLRKMGDKLKNPTDKIGPDANFHLAVAEATNNFVFVSMMESNMSMMRQVRRQTLTTVARYEASMQEHKAILEAIERRDEHAAVAATRAHLQSLKESVLKA